MLLLQEDFVVFGNLGIMHLCSSAYSLSHFDNVQACQASASRVDMNLAPISLWACS